VDRGEHFARRTAHPAVGHQRDAEASVLHDAEHRRELVQLGHAVGLGPLEPHDDHDVTVQFACLECAHDLRLTVEHAARRLDHPLLGVDRRDLAHGSP